MFKLEDIEIPANTKKRGTLKIAEATSHTVTLPYIIINGAQDGPVLTILSGVHAVECAPIEAMLRLSDQIKSEQLKGTLIILPVVNTEGFHTRKPYSNQLDHLNQNKVFPGDSNGPITKKVAHVVFNYFVSKSDYLVDCHSADLGEDATKGIFIYRTEDDNLKQQMIEMASCFECNYIETTGVTGNTGEAVIMYGIPCIMTESGTPYPLREKDIHYHLDGVINLMKYLKMLKGSPEIRKVPLDPKTVRLWAKKGGAWRHRLKVGQRVTEGQELGKITSLTGETLQVVTASKTGVVSFLRTHYSVNQGDTLLWIAQV
jgi:predicted deacylase